MPSTTPKGYPYPLGTDRVMDGDDSIHALATAVDKRQPLSGNGAISSLATGTSTNVAVTFPAGSFVNVPNVLCGCSSSRVTCGSGVVTATGFTMSASNWSPANVPAGGSTVFWSAHSTDPI